MEIPKHLLFLLFFFTFCINVLAQEGSIDKNTAFLDSISNNPSGMIYFFDNKEITERHMYEKGINGELNNSSGVMYTKSKEAISRFGERYRYGAMFWESNNKKKDEKHYDQNTQYELKGKIGRQFNDKQVTLFTFSNDSILKVDTAEVINGYFTFSGPEHTDDISILSIGNYPDTVVSQIVILDKGSIEVDMDKGRVGGTRLNNLYQSYIDTTLIFNKEIGKLIGEGENPNIIITGSHREKKLVEMGKYMVDFKMRNIENAAGQYFFEKEAGKSFAEILAFPSSESCPDSAFYIIYNAASEDYKQKEWIREYIESLNHDMQLLQEQAISRQYVNFALTGDSGAKQNISDYIGKSRFTLLDLWASWCGPCIASFPKLTDFYTSYSRDDLEIISISLDTNQEAWKDALERINTPWIHLIVETPQLQAKIMEAYSFKGIPFAVLINKEGKIIYSGNRSAVMQKLSEYLGG